MERNREALRQLRILRQLEYARYGETLESLADAHEVTTRTIRRDMKALEELGVPIERADREGRTFWRLSRTPYGTLPDTSFSLSELCALYMSRTLLEGLASAPFQMDLKCAFEKLENALAPKMCEFLDRLPSVLGTKAGATKRSQQRTHEAIARILQASIEHRRVRMIYHSFSSGRRRNYVVEPYRLICAQGGVYFVAFVPAYRQVRTFAVERVRRLSISEDTFTPDQDITQDAFPNSLGVNVGDPVDVELEFASRIAPYVQERIYHRTQKTSVREDGTLAMRLRVCNDWALRSWILGFGPFVHVISPIALVHEILAELDEARNRYMPRLELDAPKGSADRAGQPWLPFARRRTAS
jgi:predicted DNA-binding transcriptional regulator YafY